MSELRENLQNLNDEELDRFFYYSFGEAQREAASVIVERLTSAWSFIGGIFGRERFPLYSASTKFSQTEAAQSSVKTQAGKVAAEIGKASYNITWPFIVLGIIVLVFFIVLKWKK